MNLLVCTLMENLDSYLEMFLGNLGIWGALLSCILITVESILPFLPICVFITLVFYKFGNIFGFIMSWLFTCFGCFLSFSLVRSKIKTWIENKILNKKELKKVDKFMSYIDKITLSELALLVAIPFTPASVVNVAAGLSNMSRKKFVVGILIGKLFMVYFWGYVGTTLIESFTDPINIIKIIIMLLVAYVFSKLINKYLKID